MANPYTLDGSDVIPPPVLPDGGEYATIAMRYKNTELAFCMKPEHMEHGLVPTIEKLRECVMTEAEKGV